MKLRTLLLQLAILVCFFPFSSVYAGELSVPVVESVVDQGLSAATKSEMVWAKIASRPYDKLPDMTFIPTGQSSRSHVGHTIDSGSNLGQSFDHVSDEMPTGRIKVIHAYGSSAAIEFVAEPGHPLTGLFRSGAPGIVRLSLGTPFATTGSFVPGMAIKLFVDGQASKNMHVMEKLEGQGDNRDFFQATFTNSLPEPTSFSTKVGKKYFGRFVESPIFLTVDHVAAVDRSGVVANPMVAPAQIYFVPADGLHQDANGADFRVELAKIPAGTKLYDVYAKVSKFSKGLTSIGSIVTKSNFVASEYSDKSLFFQHEGSVRRTFFLGRRIKK